MRRLGFHVVVWRWGLHGSSAYPQLSISSKLDVESREQVATKASSTPTMNELLKITRERFLLDVVGTARVFEKVGVVRMTTTGSVVEAFSVDIGLDCASLSSAVESPVSLQDGLTAVNRSDPSVVQLLVFHESMGVL